jgi:hypothetical protein
MTYLFDINVNSKIKDVVDIPNFMGDFIKKIKKRLKILYTMFPKFLLNPDDKD